MLTIVFPLHHAHDSLFSSSHPSPPYDRVVARVESEDDVRDTIVVTLVTSSHKEVAWRIEHPQAARCKIPTTHESPSKKA